MNWHLLQNSLLVAGTTTALALGFGLLAALWLATLEARWRNGCLALAIVALALPPFLMTNCWISLLGETGVLRTWLPFKIYSLGGTIWILSLMLWPITAFAVLSAWRRLEAPQFECEPALTGFALLRWLLLPVASREAGLAALLTFVLALNNFAVPAILQTRVLPDELWVQFNTTFFQRPGGGFDWVRMLRLSLPLVLAPILMLAWITRRGVAWPRAQGAVSARVFRRQLGPTWRIGCGTLALSLCAVSVGLPLAQIALATRTWTELPGAVEAGTGAMWNSFWFAALAATMVVVVAQIGNLPYRRLAVGRQVTNLRHGRLPICATVAWLPFLIPGVLLGIALIWLFNRPPFLDFYQSAGIVVLAFVVRYFALGWTAARHAIGSVDSDLTDAARLEGATIWQRLRLVTWPQTAPQVAAAWYVVYLLCLWDVESMVLIVPPGGETLALRIFNLLHFGHNAQVNALCVTLLGLAVLPLVLWGGGNWVMQKTSNIQHPTSREAPNSKLQTMAARTSFGAWSLKFLWCLVLGAWCFSSGCSKRPDANAHVQSKFFEHATVIGSRGVGIGEFNKPRSVACDSQDNVFAVDMTGRVQKFSPDGEFLLSWQMPETTLGKAKGMGRDRDGNILVIEPHYQRVNHYAPDGKLLAQWGCQGTQAGCFTLPRAVAVNSRGEIFVSQYMGEERVQRFALPVQSPPVTPAAVEVRSPESGVQSQPLSPSEGERMPRANRRALNPRTDERPLSLPSPPLGAGERVADLSAVALAKAEGRERARFMGRENPPQSPDAEVEPRLLQVIGKAGTGLGEFNRPEGICVDAQGRLYVADSCNHRIQIFSSDGQVIRAYGKAGSGKGELSYPYDIAVDAEGNQFVCEFGNSRIQVFDANCAPVEIIGGPGAEPGRFANPWAVALDSHGNLYVADSQNHRVQKLVRKESVVSSQWSVARDHSSSTASDGGRRTTDY